MVEATKKETVLLSELNDDVILSYEDSHLTFTPSELRKEMELDVYLKEKTFYVATAHEWKPNAKRMVENYIENEYDNGMYEDWDDRAYDCLKPEHYERIQAVLDDAFKGDHATKYWMLDGPEVIID